MVHTPTVPAVEKLPLAARKNIRDEWESKVAELTKEVSDILKEPYKLEVNFNQLYAYADATDSSWLKSSPGSAATQYFKGFIDHLKRFTEDGKYDEAIQSFNELITERKIMIEGDPEVSYSGCKVENGVFEITYNPTSPGSNVDYACTDFPKNFDAGLFAKSPETVPMMARKGLRDDYDSEKEALLKKYKDQLLGAEVKLMADYEAIWNTIVAGKAKNKDLDLQSISRNFGRTIYSYFNGLVYQMDIRFQKDDMVVEAFTEEVSTGEIWIEVAPEGTELKNTYSEMELRDGKFIIKTTPSNFGTNADYVAVDIIKMF